MGCFEDDLEQLKLAIHSILNALFSTLNTIDVMASNQTPLHPLQAFLMVTNINDYGIFKGAQRISSSCSTIVWNLRAFLAVEVDNQSNDTTQQIRFVLLHRTVWPCKLTPS